MLCCHSISCRISTQFLLSSDFWCIFQSRPTTNKNIAEINLSSLPTCAFKMRKYGAVKFVFQPAFTSTNDFIEESINRE